MRASADCFRAPPWIIRNRQKLRHLGRRTNRGTLMLDRCFLLLDIFVNQTRYAPTRKTTWRLIFGLAFGVAHKPEIERFLGTDVVIVVESELAALATLKIFCHGFLPLRSQSSASAVCFFTANKLVTFRHEHSEQPGSGQHGCGTRRLRNHQFYCIAKNRSSASGALKKSLTVGSHD